MNSTSLNGLSPSYIKATLADQLNTGSLNSSSKNSKTTQPSTFFQMLSDASSANAANASTTSANPSQMLAQSVYNYQAGGIQNQSQSFDPMSIGA